MLGEIQTESLGQTTRDCVPLRSGNDGVEPSSHVSMGPRRDVPGAQYEEPPVDDSAISSEIPGNHGVCQQGVGTPFLPLSPRTSKAHLSLPDCEMQHVRPIRLRGADADGSGNGPTILPQVSWGSQDSRAMPPRPNWRSAIPGGTLLRGWARSCLSCPRATQGRHKAGDALAAGQ
jgi:hypothetical protein